MIPALIDGQFETDPFLAEFVVEDLGKRIFELGPSEEMIEKAAEVRRKYAENGSKGGRGKRRSKATAEPTWPSLFPGYSFHPQKGEVALRGPSGLKIPVKDLSTGSEAKDLAWWNQNGPTKPMVNKYAKLAEGPRR